MIEKADRTFMGRLSTNRPLSFVSASFALPDLLKMMVAIPRLCPLGPKAMVARLTGPIDWPKYSYTERLGTELVHW